jgi:hypothetical protein
VRWDYTGEAELLILAQNRVIVDGMKVGKENGGVMQKCLPPREILPHFADQAAGYPILGPRVGYSCLKALKVSLEQDKIGL